MCQADRPGRSGLLPLPLFPDPLSIRDGLVAGLYLLAQLGRPYAVLMPIHADLAQFFGYAAAILPFDDVGDRRGRTVQRQRAVSQAAGSELNKQVPKMGRGGADCVFGLDPGRILGDFKESCRRRFGRNFWLDKNFPILSRRRGGRGRGNS